MDAAMNLTVQFPGLYYLSLGIKLWACIEPFPFSWKALGIFYFILG